MVDSLKAASFVYTLNEVMMNNGVQIWILYLNNLTRWLINVKTGFGNKSSTLPQHIHITYNLLNFKYNLKDDKNTALL